MLRLTQMLLLVSMHTMRGRPLETTKILPVQHPTYQMVSKVFNNVSHAFGSVLSPPVLQIVASSKTKKLIGAYYNRLKTPTVQIDEEVVILCKQLGEDSLNALAYVVGHELAHHFKQHLIADTYGLNQPPQVEKEQEFEADKNGYYYAQIAGYQSTIAGGEIIRAIYLRNNFIKQNGAPMSNTILKNYPSLEIRQQIGRELLTQIRALALVFQAGQLFYVTRHYSDAAVCFDKLANKFPSRELYNNLGCAYLQAYLANLPPEEQAYVYPFEFDPQTRLQAPPPPLRSRGDQLTEAQQALEIALKLDKTYWPARINLACAYLLNKNWEAALGELKKQPNLPADAYTVQALAYEQSGQTKQASTSFKKALLYHGYSAEYNYTLYNRKHNQAWTKFEDWIRSIFINEEKKSQLPQSIPNLISSKAAYIPNFCYEISDKPYLKILTDSSRSDMSWFEVKTPNIKFLWQQASTQAHLVGNGPAIKTLGISSGQYTKHKLGQADAHLTHFNATNGIIEVYTDFNTIIQYDNNQQIKYWGQYKIR